MHVFFYLISSEAASFDFLLFILVFTSIFLSNVLIIDVPWFMCWIFAIDFLLCYLRLSLSSAYLFPYLLLPWKQFYQNTCIDEQRLCYYFYTDTILCWVKQCILPTFNFLFYIEIKNYLVFSLLGLLRVHCCFPPMLQLTCSLFVFEISEQFQTLYYIFSLGDISTAPCPAFSVDCCSFSSWTPCFPGFVFLCFCCFIF